METTKKYVLSKEEVKANNRFYNDLIDSFGDGPESVGWFSSKTQEKRFQILLEIELFTSKKIAKARILDVGCGLGHLYRYLKRKGGCGDYLGVDINPHAVERAKGLNPGVKFRCCDLLEEEVESFDFVFASGAMSFRVKNNQGFMRAMIERIYAIADVGVAFNFLNERDYFLGGLLYHYNEAEILSFCQENFGSKAKVFLRSDYLVYDSTIYLVKTP